LNIDMLVLIDTNLWYNYIKHISWRDW